jgi:hypothetical protein
MRKVLAQDKHFARKHLSEEPVVALTPQHAADSLTERFTTRASPAHPQAAVAAQTSHPPGAAVPPRPSTPRGRARSQVAR